MGRKYCKILSFIFLPALSVLLSSAQDQQPIAISTDRGIWLYLGNEIPDGFQYQIFRKEDKGKFNLIGSTSYSEDEKSISSIMELFSPMFENMEKPGNEEISLLREYTSRNKTTDSIYIPNFPLMHLAFGTAYFDEKVQSGKSYQYQVRKIKDKDSMEWEKLSNILVYPELTDILKPEFKGKQEFTSQVFLQWYVPEQRNLNSFSVYRSIFGRNEFKKINAIKGFNSSEDTIFLIVQDTMVENPAFYEYYIKPLDLYGNSGPDSEIAAAGTITGTYNPAPEYFNARGGEKNYEIILTWKFNDLQYLRSIEVYRSTSFDNGFTRIARLSPQDSTYTDVVNRANENYWYYLVMNGPIENSLPTAKVSAMYRSIGEAPPPPEEIDAESVPGGVKVYWSYYEPFAKGFYVYRYVYEIAEYTQISDLIPVDSAIYSYTDSSEYLQGNETYRYAVKVVNDLDQISDFSESASAVPDKKVTVESPENLRINKTEDGIILIWDDMHEALSTLLGYKIYRKTLPDKEFSRLENDTLRNDINYYRDSDLVPGKSYTYSVSAIDFFGNESEKSIAITWHTEEEYYISPAISSLSNTPEGIVIKWNQITDENIVSIKIYRSQPGTEPNLIATLEKLEDNYLDNSVKEGELYIYEISVLTADGREYEKSNGMSLRR